MHLGKLALSWFQHYVLVLLARKYVVHYLNGAITEKSLTAQEAKARMRAQKAAEAAVEPVLIERHHLRAEDEEIRATDLPEREQLARRSRGGEPQLQDSAVCAQ